MEQNYYNNEQNMQNAQNMQNTQYDAYGRPIPPMQPMQPVRHKNGKLRTVIALIAAVAVVGGGAGFGGALLAKDIIRTNEPAAAADTSEGKVTATYNIEDKTTDNGGSSPNGDVSAALNAINDSGSGGISGKVYPTDVTPTGANGTYTTEELYEAVNDTIVLIKVYKKQTNSYSNYYDYYFGFGDSYSDSEKDSEPVYSGYGSGIVFTEDGYILTNAHVVSEAAKLEVVVNDYNDPEATHEYTATVVGSDDSSDIAVIKIERDEPLIAAKIGDSDSLKVGQQVCAIGNPGVTAKVLFDHTMTAGIVSGLDIECLADNGYSLSLIQTDAAINSGNSGGGLFDMYGNVVGVVNSKIIVSTYEGLGFALTINEAKPIMEDLLNYGYVKSRPVLGITTVPLNEYRAQLYGTKLTQGLLVTALNEGAPVTTSGLQVSDIITKINGKNVTSVEDVQTIISKFRVGDKVTATVARTNDAGGVDSVEIEITLTSASKS